MKRVLYLVILLIMGYIDILSQPPVKCEKISDFEYLLTVGPFLQHNSYSSRGSFMGENMLAKEKRYQYIKYDTTYSYDWVHNDTVMQIKSVVEDSMITYHIYVADPNYRGRISVVMRHNYELDTIFHLEYTPVRTDYLIWTFPKTIDMGFMKIGDIKDTILVIKRITPLDKQILIRDIYLNNGKNGYELVSCVLPYFLEELEDSLKFGIRFVATKVGVFKNTISFDETSASLPKIELISNVALNSISENGSIMSIIKESEYYDLMGRKIQNIEEYQGLYLKRNGNIVEKLWK